MLENGEQDKEQEQMWLGWYLSQFFIVRILETNWKLSISVTFSRDIPTLRQSSGLRMKTQNLESSSVAECVLAFARSWIPTCTAINNSNKRPGISKLMGCLSERWGQLRLVMWRSREEHGFNELVRWSLNAKWQAKGQVRGRHMEAAPRMLFPGWSVAHCTENPSDLKTHLEKVFKWKKITPKSFV